MNNKNTLISCVIPTFNRVDLLKKAIESTIHQTYSNWEMIIIDDGSTDETKKVVLKYTRFDKRIKYLKNPGKGASAARNYGIKKARGDWIAFLDDDDINLPQRFESQLNAVVQFGKQFLISGSICILKKGKKIIKTNEFKAKGAGHTSRWFIKKDLLMQAGLFDESIPSMEENELSYRIAKHEVFALQTEVVIIKNFSENSLGIGKFALQGKKMLIEKQKDNMHSIEAAWWYFIIALGNLSLDQTDEALNSLYKAACYDSRGLYKWAWIIAKSARRLGVINNRLTRKLLKFFAYYRFPVLVEHPIISDNYE